MKKFNIILVVLALIFVAGYLFIRFSVLKTNANYSKAEPSKVRASKPETILDLRPALIAKLQQLVKDGSEGLYNLNIKQVEPDVPLSRITLIKAALIPDTAALKKLDDARKAPDDVFKVSFDSLHIDGIGIQDILSKKNIDIKAIFLNNPVIEVYHKEKSYNENKRRQNDSATLYQRLMKHITSVSIDKIKVHNGTLINRNLSPKGSATAYKNVTISVNRLLIDSTTQYDKSRYLFAKEVNISIPEYLMHTPDSLYVFKCGAVNISASKKMLTAKNVSLEPRLSKLQFRKKLTTRKDMYTMKVAKLVLSGIDWWKLQNRRNLVAKETDIYNGMLSIYLDRTLPSSPGFKIGNFPHQSLKKIRMPISLEKVNLHGVDFSYTEYDPEIDKTGTVYFDDINGRITNITNIPAQMKKSRQSFANVTALFMHKAPVKANFKFDLVKVNSGDFSVDLQMGKLDTALLNPIAEPLGLFTIKTGTVEKATAHVNGNNYQANANVLFLYNDLHLTPLKKDENKKSELKKKRFTGTLANIFFIKNSNPGKNGEVRNPQYMIKRDQHPNFFNFAWKTVLTGILKTIGIPEKYANK